MFYWQKNQHLINCLMNFTKLYYSEHLCVLPHHHVIHQYLNQFLIFITQQLWILKRMKQIAPRLCFCVKTVFTDIGVLVIKVRWPRWSYYLNVNSYTGEILVLYWNRTLRITFVSTVMYGLKWYMALQHTGMTRTHHYWGNHRLPLLGLQPLISVLPIYGLHGPSSQIFHIDDLVPKSLYSRALTRDLFLICINQTVWTKAKMLTNKLGMCRAIDWLSCYMLNSCNTVSYLSA